jgi:hypothetical protein
MLLLRRHYRDQRIPAVLDARLIQLLRQNKSFDDWPLEVLVQIVRPSLCSSRNDGPSILTEWRLMMRHTS